MALKILRIVSSLRFAIFILIILTLGLVLGTFLESSFDTPTAQYWVYRAKWFCGVMILLGLCLVAVMVDRLPWKAKHIPFILAHIGILTLLLGSWITQRAGIDGQMRVVEGESNHIVELDQHFLYLQDSAGLNESAAVPWIPPSVSFLPYWASQNARIRITQYLTHGDPHLNFQEALDPQAFASPQMAIQLKLLGGPMNLNQDLWLWEGDPQFSEKAMGPATFAIGSLPANQLGLAFKHKAGTLLAQVNRSKGAPLLLKWSEKDLAHQPLIETGWKGGVKAQILQVIWSAEPRVHYTPSAVQYGQKAAPPAIEVSVCPNLCTQKLWLGLGDRHYLKIEDKILWLSFLPQRVALPFNLELKKFIIDHDPGTQNPAAYRSQVVFSEGKETTIEMNHPLEEQGYTLYQSSYEGMESSSRMASIFSVNRDPGRGFKYLGSALMVLGSILLFVLKKRKASIC